MYFIGMLFAYLKVHGSLKGTIPHGENIMLVADFI
jgi:hypothetical protein